MYALLVGFVTFIICCYVALSRKFLYWKKRGVPHPRYSKIFGNLSESILMKKSLGQIIDDIYNAYPSLPYVGMYRMRQPVLLIRDPEIATKVLIKDFSSFHENDIDVDKESDYLIAKNPFFSKGTDWKTSRGQLAPSFTNHRMKTIFPLMESVSQNFVEHLEDHVVANGGINIKTLCEKYTMDVVALSVLGLEANSFKSVNTEYLKNIKKILSPGFLMTIKFTILTLLPLLAKFLKIKFVPEDAGNYFKKIIKNTLDYRQKNNINRNDFLQSMKELQQKLGTQVFSDDDITAHSLSFFIDGFETSSIVLSYTLYELGANIEHQKKLREEIENTLKKENGKLTFDSINEMTFLNKFLKETLRRNPPALVLSKRCTKAYQLPPVNTESEQILIEPGTPIMIPVYSLHYDPKYFPNPEKFDPERFSDENDLKNCVFMPFGEGPRKCIGQKYAMAQIRIAIVQLVLNYDILVNPKTITPLQMDPAYFLLSPKGGIWLNFIKRKKCQ